MGGAAKAANDPKQRAKAAVKVFWQERREGKHPKLRSQEKFANECLDRWPILTSQKVILRWCAQWNREAKKARHPAS